MEPAKFSNEVLEFQYPPTCQLISDDRNAAGGAIELAHMLGDKRVARIYVRWHQMAGDERLSFLANEHRQELLKLGLKVADSTLLPAPVPERFDEAAYYQPPTHKNRVDLDAPVVIFCKGRTLVSVGMVGPGEDVSKILWQGNQNAFEFVRESLNVLQAEPTGHQAPKNPS